MIIKIKLLESMDSDKVQYYKLILSEPIPYVRGSLMYWIDNKHIILQMDNVTDVFITAELFNKLDMKESGDIITCDISHLFLDVSRPKYDLDTKELVKPSRCWLVDRPFSYLSFKR